MVTMRPTSLSLHSSFAGHSSLLPSLLFFCQIICLSGLPFVARAKRERRMAEGTGFEPAFRQRRSMVFKTSLLVHSSTPPWFFLLRPPVGGLRRINSADSDVTSESLIEQDQPVSPLRTPPWPKAIRHLKLWMDAVHPKL